MNKKCCNAGQTYCDSITFKITDFALNQLSKLFKLTMNSYPTRATIFFNQCRHFTSICLKSYNLLHFNMLNPS